MLTFNAKVTELSLKRKSFGEIVVIRKKLFYVKRNFMCREFILSFFDVIFHIFDKGRRVQRKC